MPDACPFLPASIIFFSCLRVSGPPPHRSKNAEQIPLLDPSMDPVSSLPNYRLQQLRYRHRCVTLEKLVRSCPMSSSCRHSMSTTATRAPCSRAKWIYPAAGKTLAWVPIASSMTGTRTAKRRRDAAGWCISGSKATLSVGCLSTAPSHP